MLTQKRSSFSFLSPLNRWRRLFLFGFLCCLLSSSTINALVDFNSPHGLPELEKCLQRDLLLLNYPKAPWRTTQHVNTHAPTYDVVIIGSGMSGMTAAFALIKAGIPNILLLDKNPQGQEGPWMNYARMKTLRSDKAPVGPALNIPNLTFQAWFQAQFGEQAWEQLYKIPTVQWMEYLNWYRKILRLPIENECTVQLITPVDVNLFQLKVCSKNQLREIYTHKVVLATGRNGFGGAEIPVFIKNLPKSHWSHTSENIDFNLIKGKRICVVGVGASAFDASGAALEAGALSIKMLMRRPHLPSIGKLASLSHEGCSLGFYALKDDEKWKIFSLAFQQGTPPPLEALERVAKFKAFSLQANTDIKSISLRKNGEIEIATNKNTLLCDYIILGTGFAIDGSKQPELHPIIQEIRLWNEPRSTMPCAKLGRFPYLGPHFEFMEKTPGTAPYLKNIHCFNYGALLTHGWISSDIDTIDIGVYRLVEGIVSDLFTQDFPSQYHQLENYNTPIFQESDYNF